MGEQLAEALVELREAVKRFRTPEGSVIAALDGIDLGVGANEFVTLLGPSGCGKTTLLRCISGFEDLDSGSLLIGGVPMGGVPPHRRPVNTVFQNYALFPHMTVGGNVAYALEVAGVPKAERTARVAKALALVNLEGMERRKPSQLSGGQQQRVALARAIIAQPKILLLDEPLSALDRRLRQAMQLELKNLQSELGISFVYVTHDQEEALTMSDRIVVLNSGRIQQVGSPAEVYHRPANAFVAEFLGDSNLFDATLVGVEGDRARYETEDGLVLIGKAGGRTKGARVKILLRPENFELAPSSASAASAAVLEGKLAQEVFLGTDYHLMVRTAGDRTIKATVRDAQREGLPQISEGATIRLHYQPHRAHVIAA